MKSMFFNTYTAHMNQIVQCFQTNLKLVSSLCNGLALKARLLYIRYTVAVVFQSSELNVLMLALF